MIENYLDRNGGWLIPLFVGLIVALATIMLEMVEITSPLPSWVSDTFSAKIIRFLAGVFATGMVILMIFRIFH